MEEKFNDKDKILDSDIEEKIELETNENNEVIGDTIGLYLKSLPDLLTKEEEEELGYRILKGDVDAINTMVEKNLKLVVSIAKNYQGSGLSFEDIIQNGNLGLMKAARMFDVRKGDKFSTYATNLIQQAIRSEDGINSRNIKIPFHYKEIIRKYKVLKNKLIVQYGEAPSKEEMAKKLGVSIEVIDRCELLLDDIASLNVMVGDGNYTELWETLPSDVKTPEEAMLSIDLRERTEEMLGELTPIEIEVIRLSFGFDGKCFMPNEIGQLMVYLLLQEHLCEYSTLEEIKKLEILIQRSIRHIEEKTLKKLRHPSRRYMLEPYTEDIIQNGNLGLMRAARMFDVRKGYKFSTYATNWIKQAIRREADNTSKNIRVPSHFEATIRKYKALKNKLTCQYGEESSREEMARELDVSVEVIDKCEWLLNDIASLNVTVGDEKETEFGELIASDVKTPEEEMLDTDLREKTEEILNSGVLTSREIEIIRLRFGFDGRRLTLEEIGQLIGLTRERVRQIEKQALKKLKSSRKRHMIESYSEDRVYRKSRKK